MATDPQRQIAKELTLALTSLVVKPGPMPVDPAPVARQLTDLYANILSEVVKAG